MSQIQDTLIYLHSVLRWLILSLALFGAARSFVSMLSVSARFTRLDLGVSRAYAALLDVQLLVGILLVLAALTLQQPVPWIHPIIMIPAVIVAHLSRRFVAQPDRKRHQAQLAIYLGSLALVVIGLAVIGQLYLPR
jgi:SNF family Na+-dependent transporter